MIIEDGPDVAQSLKEFLELAGHEVVVAPDGIEGLERARRFQPAVVLCDIGLPGMDGYEVARAFREDNELKDTRLVALTGYAQPDDVQRAAAAGFDQHLAKPASFATLEEVLLAPAGRSTDTRG
jgi:CheY-like chemotaxis protein